MRKIGLLVRRVGACPRVLGVGVLLVALALAWPATVAYAAAGPATTPEATPPPADEFGRGTPLGAARGFLDATALRNYRRATSYLDLRRVPQAEVATRGPELARQLRVVLDNTVYDLGAISDEPEGRLEPGLPKNRELIGRVQTDKGTFSVLLERV